MICNIHRKYLAENPCYTVSYVALTRLHPFYVLQSTVKDVYVQNSRTSCIHCQQTSSVAILQTANLEALADSISSNPESKNVCTKSGVSAEAKHALSCFDQTIDMTYLLWQTTCDNYIKVHCHFSNSVRCTGLISFATSATTIQPSANTYYIRKLCDMHKVLTANLFIPTSVQ